jgi:hypothetical protein
MRKSFIVRQPAWALAALAVVLFGLVGCTSSTAPGPVADAVPSPTVDGYRGIWFTLGQFSEYGDKYSGGLGTYTSHHVPMAVYAPEVERTFFTYGGTPAGDQRYLLNMVGAYDHRTQTVVKPVIVHDKGVGGVDDPHDNASLALAGDGHLWLFVSGRGVSRPGFIYRSVRPYAIDAWERIHEGEFTYPQPWWVEGVGFVHLYTRYVAGQGPRARELFVRRSATGREWGEERAVAAFGGHYQVSEQRGRRIVSAFNWHPERNVDKRTDLYFVQTTDAGETWTTVNGEPLSLPLTEADNPARVRDYASEGLLVYVMDVTFDAHGRPIILYITSRDHRPGPAGNPRRWTIAHWADEAWVFHEIADAGHNYDTGSLQLDPDGAWRLTGPTEIGPQPHGTGGEIAMWVSHDEGRSWTRERQLTEDSERNHGYARRPRHAHPDFHTYWADGDADRLSPSHLYFTNRDGTVVRRLPYSMSGDSAPVEVPD